MAVLWLCDLTTLTFLILSAGRCYNKKDARFLVAFGINFGHSENQQAHCEPLCIPRSWWQFGSHRGMNPICFNFLIFVPNSKSIFMQRTQICSSQKNYVSSQSFKNSSHQAVEDILTFHCQLTHAIGFIGFISCSSQPPWLDLLFSFLILLGSLKDFPIKIVIKSSFLFN